MDYIEKMPVRIRVAEIVRDAILSGEFAAGRELSLTDTAAQLRVSRTPVREAFQMLQAEGLIELRMNRGAVVKPIDEEFITDHFDIRRLLEGEAVYRAIRRRIDPTPLVELQRAITDAAASSEVAALYDAYNQDFHQILWQGSGSRKLHAFLETLWNGPSYSHTRGSDVDHVASIAEHAQLIEYVQQGDAERGRRLMEDHILRSLDIILATVRGQQAK